MAIGIILQARIGSTRLPQKVILPFFNGVGILETIIFRLKQANLKVPIVVATTTESSDDIISEIANRQNIITFRGSENNVLNRFIKSAEDNSIQKIIRICADNPFLDMNALKHQIKSFEGMDTDYWCYSRSDKTPTIKTHYGFWTEGVTLSALKRVNKLTNEVLYQEHVTNYIYTNPEIFKIHFENISQSDEFATDIRLTIDTDKDFEIAKEIYIQLINKNIPFESHHVINFIKSKPIWISVMKNQIITNNK